MTDPMIERLTKALGGTVSAPFDPRSGDKVTTTIRYRWATAEEIAAMDAAREGEP